MNIQYDRKYILSVGIPSFCSHIETTCRYHSEFITEEKFNNFLKDNVYGFLTSFGNSFVKGKPLTSKIVNKVSNIVKTYRNKDYFRGINLTMDSSGYQIQQGYVQKDHLSDLFDYYHEFLQICENEYQAAFPVDVSPGASYCVVDNYKELLDYNVESLEKLDKLPQSIKDKILYIQHFRTPKINELYKTLLFDMDMANSYKNFATGGIVSFANSGGLFPVVAYTIPLVYLIKYTKSKNIKSFRFHILGGTEWKSLYTYYILEKHIKEVHDIDINITVDSSTMFQCFFKGRYLYVLDGGKMYKMFLNEDVKDNRWRGRGSAEDVFYELMEEISLKYNLGILNKKDYPIYSEGKTTRYAYIAGALQTLNQYKCVEQMCKQYANISYEFYKAGDVEGFFEYSDNIMLSFNNGKISKVANGKTISLVNSLSLLESLDEDYCDFLINKYMAKDEHENLLSVKPNHIVF